jgi:translation initiation factor IF-3
MTTRAGTHPRLNDQIRSPRVRLIGADGEQLGILPLRTALQAAKDAELDLVEVAADADPPVCRLMNYGRYRFELSARDKENRRRAAKVELKEMRYSVRIGPGDFDTKTRKVAAFLAAGHRVKVSVRFRRGRELSRPQFGRDLLDRVIGELGETAKVESMPRLDGTFLSMLLAPAKRGAP